MRRAQGIVAVIAAVLAAAHPAAGLSARLTSDEIVQRGHSIVVGTVICSSTRWGDGKKMIWTDYELAVEETWKGEPARSVTVSFAGGTVDGQSIFVTHVPVLEVGSTYALSLHEPGHLYPSPVVGSEQGLFHVVKDEATGERVFLDAEGFAVIFGKDRPPKRLQGPRRAAPDRAAAEPGSASAGYPDREGCWCGYQTPVPRSFVVRGTGSDAAQKEAAADMLREWNRFVNLFDVSVDSTPTLGSQNGVNEVNVFITKTESKARYGIELDFATFGMAVIYPSASYGHVPECKQFDPAGCGAFTETDVVINADFFRGWTGNWFSKGSDLGGGAALIQSTVLHEVGHTLGLHHVFDVPEGAGAGNSLSVMNYMNDDAGKFVRRIDSKTVRAEYPGASRSFVDMAVSPLVYGNESYGHTYASLSKPSVQTGEQLTVSNWLIQNVGSEKAGAIRVTFFVFPAGLRPYPEPSDVAVGMVELPEGADVNSEKEMVATLLEVPDGTPPGDYWVGAIVTVGGQEDTPWIVGKPSNNRMVIGHDPFVSLRVVRGSGPLPLAADFKFDPANPQSGQTVGFVDISRGNPMSLSWNFGDPASGVANSSSERNPEHVYASAGSYTVTLIVATGSTKSTTSRQIVVTPNFGEGLSRATSVIPVLIDFPGGASSELTLTNCGTTSATVRLGYTAAPLFGGQGSGTATATIGAGRQVIVGNAIEYLRGKGLPIPAGNQLGSLRLDFEGLSEARAAHASVRSTTPVAAVGRAGVSYAGVDAKALFTEPVAIFGLRENASDRSHVALINASPAGPVRLTIYVHSGDGTRSYQPDPVTLQPGQWSQLDNVLEQADPTLTEGWVVIDPGPLTGPYLAYGLINDNGTNDGSYVTAVPDGKIDFTYCIPVVVEIGDAVSSELFLVNPSGRPIAAMLEFVESLANPGGLATGSFRVELAPFEQRLLPGIVNTLREMKSAPFPLPKGPAYAGALSVLFLDDQAFMAPGLAGVRTSHPATATPGRYGVFISSLANDPSKQPTPRNAWLYGLQQNSTVRSNLAIVNPGETPITVKMELFNGDTGNAVKSVTLDALARLEWRQLDRVLESYAPGVTNGYVRLSVVEGDGGFFAYAVLNDGTHPGQGTGDGSYVEMVVSQ